MTADAALALRRMSPSSTRWGTWWAPAGSGSRAAASSARLARPMPAKQSRNASFGALSRILWYLKQAHCPCIPPRPARVLPRHCCASACTVYSAHGWVLESAKHVAPLCLRRSRHDREDVRREVQILHHLGGHPHITQLKGVFEGPQSVHLVRTPPAQGRSPEAGRFLPPLAACHFDISSRVCWSCLECSWTCRWHCAPAPTPAPWEGAGPAGDGAVLRRRAVRQDSVARPLQVTAREEGAGGSSLPVSPAFVCRVALWAAGEVRALRVARPLQDPFMPAHHNLPR